MAATKPRQKEVTTREVASIRFGMYSDDEVGITSSSSSSSSGSSSSSSLAQAIEATRRAYMSSV
jgi:hypothetical protein